MLIGDHEDCLECSGINIAVLWLELLILVRNPVGLQIVSTRSRWLSTVYFHPLYRGTWFPTRLLGERLENRIELFPSAISRYLVSNHESYRQHIRVQHRFHPLYRGTWFPTFLQWCHLEPSIGCFHPLYRGTWFPT